MNKRVRRNKEEGKIAGVCAGLGDYFNIDPVIFRLAFVVAFFMGGGLVAYIVAWIVIPTG